MRIDKVEIDGFGKLNNCSYDFSKGLNLIYGKNESGKSTLCEFILAMFYGLPNKSKESADDLASRIRFKPWNTENFGGRVYFTDNEDRKLIIERSFKATKRGDKVTLRNADTWEELGDGENAGEKYFGLSREGFLKTLYVKSFGADNLKSDNGEIMSRLSNLETSGDEEISYSKIINDIEKDALSLRTKTGRGGKITALDDKISALNNEKTISSLTYTALANEEKLQEELKLLAEEKEKQAKELEKQYKLAEQYEKYLSQKKVEETKKVLEKRLKLEKEKQETLKQQIENLDENVASDISTEIISKARALETKKLLAEEKLNEKSKQLPKKEQKIFDNSLIIPVFFGFAIILLGIFLQNYILYALGLLFQVIGIAVCVFMNIKVRKKDEKLRDEYYDSKVELGKINDELNEILKPYGVVISDELSSLYVATNDKTEKLSQLKNQYEECKKEIESLTEEINKETDDMVFSEDVINYRGESAQRLFEMINAQKAESKLHLEQANEISLKIAKETAEIRTEYEIEEELKEATEEKAELEKRYKALTKAIEWLNRAHADIKSNFAPRLNKKASEILAYLTNEKYPDMRSDDNFSINLKSTSGEIVEAEYMSRGTYDLIYIALRFASMSVLTNKNIPSVILDDAFSQLDDERLIRAVKLIENNEEFSQVLLFTCHEGYKEILHDSNLIEL